MRIIKLDETDTVVSIREGESPSSDEFESELGELGQIRMEGGAFVTPEPTESTPDETLEQKIDRLEKQVQEDNLMQFEVLATIYETLVTGGN